MLLGTPVRCFLDQVMWNGETPYKCGKHFPGDSFLFPSHGAGRFLYLVHNLSSSSTLLLLLPHAVLRWHQSQLFQSSRVSQRPVALQEFLRPLHQTGAAGTSSLSSYWVRDRSYTMIAIVRPPTLHPVGQFNKSSFNMYPFSQFCPSTEPWAV